MPQVHVPGVYVVMSGERRCVWSIKDVARCIGSYFPDPGTGRARTR